MTRSIMQFRPRNSPDGGMPYSPQRDIAFLFPALLNEVITSLQKDNWMEYFRGWLEAEKITEEVLSDAVGRFVDATTKFIGDPTIKSVDDAYNAVDFFGQVPAAARILLFERIGESFAAGFFVALRDVTRQGEEPPQIADIAAYIGAARLLRKCVSNKPKLVSFFPLEKKVEDLQAELEQCRDVMSRQAKLFQEEKVAIAESHKKVRKESARLATLSAWDKLPRWRKIWDLVRGTEPKSHLLTEK